MSPTPVLLVEPNVADVLKLVPLLGSLGFHVTSAENFEDAKRSMKAPPRLLITELRLGEFNGLHLVLRGRAARPDMALVVMTAVDDAVLRAEAEALGATFILKPAAPDELRAAILRTVLKNGTAPGLPIRAPFERRRVERRDRRFGLVPVERRHGDRRVDARERIGVLVLDGH